MSVNLQKFAVSVIIKLKVTLRSIVYLKLGGNYEGQILYGHQRVF